MKAKSGALEPEAKAKIPFAARLFIRLAHSPTN